MNKKILVTMIILVSAICVITAFYMSKKVIKKKDMKERFEVSRTLLSM